MVLFQGFRVFCSAFGRYFVFFHSFFVVCAIFLAKDPTKRIHLSIFLFNRYEQLKWFCWGVFRPESEVGLRKKDRFQNEDLLKNVNPRKNEKHNPLKRPLRKATNKKSPEKQNQEKYLFLWRGTC